MKRYIVLGMMALLMFLTGVHLGVSYFSDVAKSEGNEISTGDFDIGISKDGSRFYDDYRLFSFRDVAPGENRTFVFYVKNRGDYTISSVDVIFNVTDREDGEFSKAEALVDRTPDVGELSTHLIITDFRVEVDGIETVLDEYVGKTLRDVNMTVLRLFRGSLGPGDFIKVTVTFQLSPMAGNECLSDSVEVTIKVLARQ